jgi:TetR/AcrR family transcriptional regulator, cholesterol catabolism regulator
MDIRNKIIEEAGKLFIENGIKQVTMDMIAQSMGISKRTIYENFKDKDDLLSNFLYNSMIQHKEQLIRIMGESKNVIEALFNFGNYNKNSMEEINPLFFTDLKKYHSDIYTKVMNTGEVRNHELTYTLLKRGQNEGIFIKEIDLEIANLFIHYMMEFFEKVENETKCKGKKIWTSVHLPYLRGICTEKGKDILLAFSKNTENLGDN